MDENSIYDDLATQGDLGALIHDLQSRNHDLQQHVTSLEVDISKLCDKITEMKAVQDNLTKNISELYNTAKHELERKDRRIADLQSQLDALIFKRQTAPQQSGFKRKWEGNNSEDSSKRSCNYTESELNRKNNYDRKVEETLKSSTERLNPVTDFPPQPENDPSRNVYSRDGSHSRDRRDNHSREKWDSFRDNHNETRIDQRDSRLEHKDSRFDHKDSRLDHKNTILDHGESRLDHRDSRLGQRDSRLDNRDIRLDHKDSRLEHKDSRLNHKDGRLDRRDSRLDLRDSRSVNRFDHRGNRDGRRDHRENFRENRDTNKSYRDRNIDQRGRSNDQRNTNWDHNKGGPREQRYNSGDRRENHTENREKRPYEQKDVLHDNKKIRGQSSDDFKCNDVRQMEYHSENEPVFSAAESSNETITETKESKEEGELSDDEQQEKAQFAKKEKIPKKKMNLGINLPFDTKRKFSVDKFIEKQSKMGNRENNDKNSTNPKNQETKKSENINEEIPKSSRVEKVEPRDEERKQMEMSNEVILSEENPVSDEKSKKDDVVCNKDKLSKVNIISQIILHEGLEAPPSVSTSKPQPEEKNDSLGKKQENKDKPPITVPKIDKKNRESRVPRNLTEELNINLERSRKRQELLVQLFGSSEKNSRMSDQFSPPHPFGLSQDGEIPELKLFSSPDTAEIKSNSGSFDVTRQTNPVTEFQIFKTNLSSLEKSNSLSSISVQIQSPTSNTSREVSEIAQKKKEKSSPMKKTDAISKQTELSSEVPKPSENPKSEAVVKGQSTNDVCNMSMDYLNMDLAQCEAEDFPNLVALSDISDLLKTPVEEKKSVPKKSVYPVGIGKNINFNNPTTDVSVESKKIKNSSSVGVQEPNKKTLHVDKKEVIPQPKEISKVTEEKKIEHPEIDPSVQSRQISDPLLSPSQNNVQNMPKKSSNSNGRGKGKNTTKPTKTNHKKSNSSSNIDTQKPTKNEEEKSIMLSTNKESKSSPMTEVEESLELREIKEFNSNEKTPPAVVENKNHVETGDTETNKTNTSPKPTECSDISDLLLTPKEKNPNSTSRRSSNSNKMCKSKNNTDSNKQPADPTSQSSSENSSKESDKKSNPPNMNKMETRKASVEKAKEIPHQKGAKPKAPPKKKVIEIAKPKEVSEKVSTRSNIKKDKSDVCTIPALPNVDMKQCKDKNPSVSATKPHSGDIPESKKENVKTVLMGANTNKIEDGRNSTKEPIGPDVSNSSLRTTKATKEVDDVNKKPIVDKEPPGNNLNKSTENNTSNNRRRRCAIKLV